MNTATLEEKILKNTQILCSQYKHNNSKRNILNKWFQDSIKSYIMEILAAPIIQNDLNLPNTQAVKELIHSGMIKQYPMYIGIIVGYFQYIVQFKKEEVFIRNTQKRILNYISVKYSDQQMMDYNTQKKIRQSFICYLILHFFYKYIENPNCINNYLSFFQLWNSCFPQMEQKKRRMSKFEMNQQQNRVECQLQNQENQDENLEEVEDSIEEEESIQQPIKQDTEEIQISNYQRLSTSNYNSQTNFTSLTQHASQEQHIPQKISQNGCIFQENQTKQILFSQRENGINLKQINQEECQQQQQISFVQKEEYTEEKNMFNQQKKEKVQSDELFQQPQLIKQEAETIPINSLIQEQRQKYYKNQPQQLEDTKFLQNNTQKTEDQLSTQQYLLIQQQQQIQNYDECRKYHQQSLNSFFEQVQNYYKYLICLNNQEKYQSRKDLSWIKNQDFQNHLNEIKIQYEIILSLMQNQQQLQIKDQYQSQQEFQKSFMQSSENQKQEIQENLMYYQTSEQIMKINQPKLQMPTIKNENVEQQLFQKIEVGQQVQTPNEVNLGQKQQIPQQDETQQSLFYNSKKPKEIIYNQNYIEFLNQPNYLNGFNHPSTCQQNTFPKIEKFNQQQYPNYILQNQLPQQDKQKQFQHCYFESINQNPMPPFQQKQQQQPLNQYLLQNQQQQYLQEQAQLFIQTKDQFQKQPQLNLNQQLFNGNQIKTE